VTPHLIIGLGCNPIQKCPHLIVHTLKQLLDSMVSSRENRQ
jgi:hypothetical protein